MLHLVRNRPDSGAGARRRARLDPRGGRVGPGEVAHPDGGASREGGGFDLRRRMMSDDDRLALVCLLVTGPGG